MQENSIQFSTTKRYAWKYFSELFHFEIFVTLKWTSTFIKTEYKTGWMVILLTCISVMYLNDIHLFRSHLTYPEGMTMQIFAVGQKSMHLYFVNKDIELKIYIFIYTRYWKRIYKEQNWFLCAFTFPFTTVWWHAIFWQFRQEKVCKRK